MKEFLSKKEVHIFFAILILLSSLVFSRFASSPDFHEGTLASLEEKQTTLLELSVASTALSTAASFLPGDTATPISNQLANLSSHFWLILCAIFLEKYLVTLTGALAFTYLIPASCILYILWLLSGHTILRVLAGKLMLFGLLIFFLVPTSVWASNFIYETYQTSIDATLNDVRDVSAEIELSETSDNQGDSGFFSGILSSVTDGVTNVITGLKEKIGQIMNRFMESLAIMVVTCCVIPIFVLFCFMWLAKTMFSLTIPVNYSVLHKSVKKKIFRKKENVYQ